MAVAAVFFDDDLPRSFLPGIYFEFPGAMAARGVEAAAWRLVGRFFPGAVSKSIAGAGNHVLAKPFARRTGSWVRGP
ncbi:MAG: hypothetical protein ACOY31_01800 [Bacillota bacterium]